jgi:hypothetical protein
MLCCGVVWSGGVACVWLGGGCGLRRCCPLWSGVVRCGVVWCGVV